ncbi:putative phosphothreonine lyase domain-containing protein [Streptomyces sp. NPDC059445]|uniref:putative phosphothreonine lyase domain-containing protein n=1 Tax=Streptomyces sp. NPDC059445 TaxID=3346832 RepID=UPI0036ACB38A
MRAPDKLDEGLDEFGNRVTGRWMPKGIDQELWGRIRGVMIEGRLGLYAKVLEDFTQACVYTRDYRGLPDLRRILTTLRELGCDGWLDYKRDCDTARGLYGRGALYWYSPPGRLAIREPRWSVGREVDGETVLAPSHPG